MAGTSWPALVAGRKARGSDVELKFDWIEGSIAPMSGGSLTTGVHDLGTTTAYWRVGYMNSINATTTANGLAIGTTTVAQASDVGLEVAGVRAILIPRLTTTQRDNLAGINGMMVYNSTTNAFQKYENGAWTAMGGVKLGVVARVVASVTGTTKSNIVNITGTSGRLNYVIGYSVNASLYNEHTYTIDGISMSAFLLGGHTSTAHMSFAGINAGTSTTLEFAGYFTSEAGSVTSGALPPTDMRVPQAIDILFDTSLQLQHRAGAIGSTVQSYVIYERE